MLRRTLFGLAKQKHSPFVDCVKVLLSSGSGGDGASIMAHEHGNEFAGPGGGNGGNGGNVMLRCARGRQDLSHIQELGAAVSAHSGASGYAREAHGRRGRDLWLELPPGTEVIDVDTNEVVYDLSETGVEVLLLEGGQGGKGNAAFANKWHHSPVESTRGLPGNTMLAQIELKTLADCGLIGYPNAGKSSLLGAVTTSRPPVAPYPFTTLQPFVGRLHSLAGGTCSLADIPGLIEGAYEGRGLGHQFLRHVERAATLAYVIDMGGTEDPAGGAPLQPWEALERLECELEYYSPGLSERAVMVFANKMDSEAGPGEATTDAKLAVLRTRTPLPVFPVSAALGLALGPDHPQCGLAPAVQFLCERVFALQREERSRVRRQRAAQQRLLDDSFRSANNGLFAARGKRRSEEQEAEEEGEVSLVDRQLGNVFGDSGMDRDFDGYEHSRARNRLHQYRDLTMKGRFWSVSDKASSAGTNSGGRALDSGGKSGSG